MIVELIQIGNSKGIRIPKSIIAQCALTQEVELKIENNDIVIKPLHSIREHWDKAFEKMSMYGDDVFFDSDSYNEEPIFHNNDFDDKRVGVVTHGTLKVRFKV